MVTPFVKRWIVFVLMLIGIIGCSWFALRARGNIEKSLPPRGSSSQENRTAVSTSERGRPPRYLTIGQWQRAVESAMGRHEAERTRLIDRKETVDSKLYLLAVDPPTPEQIQSIRSKLEELKQSAPSGKLAASGEKLATLVRDYDPFGEEGTRVIQIDIPDEPNGRLTGFTCKADDINEMTRRFQNGKMTDLENLRGYAATYAGMPLNRFESLDLVKDALGSVYR